MSAVNQVVASLSQAAVSLTPFISTVSGGTLRNNFTGEVGFQINVGASPITVQQLARWVVSGNTGTHLIQIWSSPFSATPVSVASASVSTSGAPSGQFKFTALGSSVVLSASTTYVVSSEETSGGDQWLDSDATLTITGVGTIPNAVFRSGGSGAFTVSGAATRSFVPPNINY
jgi:hypothetical protein